MINNDRYTVDNLLKKFKFNQKDKTFSKFFISNHNFKYLTNI